MTLQIAAVCNSIESISVTGLTIRDIDNIPTQPERRTAYMIPMTDNPSEMTFSAEAFWSGGVRFYEVQYTLRYRLLYDVIGQGRTKTFEQVSGNIAMIAAILDAILATNVTVLRVQEMIPVSVAPGPVEDPAGNTWWGADINIRVTEYVNP